jgi:putative FmdB family regulatory protein
MPLYEYHCQKCGKRFEMLRRMQDSDRDLECPECRSEDLERLLSAFATAGCSPSGAGRFT